MNPQLINFFEQIQPGNVLYRYSYTDTKNKKNCCLLTVLIMLIHKRKRLAWQILSEISFQRLDSTF